MLCCLANISVFHFKYLFHRWYITSDLGVRILLCGWQLQCSDSVSILLIASSQKILYFMEFTKYISHWLQIAFLLIPCQYRSNTGTFIAGMTSQYRFIQDKNQTNLSPIGWVCIYSLVLGGIFYNHSLFFHVKSFLNCKKRHVLLQNNSNLCPE